MKVRRGVVLVVVALVVIAGGCSSSNSGSAQRAPSSSSGDASSRLACSHFFNVASDASAGLFTVDELREKLKEVHDDAKVSDVAGVRNAARAMLAAAASIDTDAFTEAVTAMGDACRKAGS